MEKTALAQVAPDLFTPQRFDGPDYDPSLDDKRLTGQLLRVYSCLKTGKWLTLGEIAGATGDPEASVSAQIRHMRKARFGAHQIDKRRRETPSVGLFEYKLIV